MNQPPITLDTFEDWLAIGYARGWVGPPVCITHDGLPTTPLEDMWTDDGDDPCIHVLRLYEDEHQRADVESNHSPSQWRASNRGLERPA